MPFAATWMDLETVIMIDVSQAENEKYHTIYDTNGYFNHFTFSYFTYQGIGKRTLDQNKNLLIKYCFSQSTKKQTWKHKQTKPWTCITAYTRKE